MIEMENRFLESTDLQQWNVLMDENGNRVYEGFTVNGKPNGAGCAYFPDGTIYQEGVFGFKGLLCGKEYYSNGELRFEGLYRYNRNYGPNYPVYGRFYDKLGVKQFEGKFEYQMTGVGYPIVKTPKNFGHVPQQYRPNFHCIMRRDKGLDNLAEVD